MRLLKSPVVISFILMAALYGAFALVLPARLLIVLGDAFAIPMSIAAAIVYFRALLDRTALADGRPLGPAHLTMLAIGGAWLTNYLDRKTRLFARLYDVTLSDSAIIGFYLFMLTFFAALHLCAIGVRIRRDEPPIEGTKVIWVALAAGCVLSGFVLYHEWTDLEPF